MGLFGGLLVAAHLVGCSFVAFMGSLVISLGENRTPAEQADAKRLGWMAIGVFLLAIAMLLCLLGRRWSLGLVAFVLEAALGIAVLVRALEESSHSDLWLYALAVGIAWTGLVALAVAMPGSNRLSLRRNML